MYCITTMYILLAPYRPLVPYYEAAISAFSGCESRYKNCLETFSLVLLIVTRHNFASLLGSNLPRIPLFRESLYPVIKKEKTYTLPCVDMCSTPAITIYPVSHHLSRKHARQTHICRTWIDVGQHCHSVSSYDLCISRDIHITTRSQPDWEDLLSFSRCAWSISNAHH
jgi:hypothetical protein